MALNPVVYTEKVVRSFLRYQLTAYPFADERLHQQLDAEISGAAQDPPDTRIPPPEPLSVVKKTIVRSRMPSSSRLLTSRPTSLSVYRTMALCLSIGVCTSGSSGVGTNGPCVSAIGKYMHIGSSLCCFMKLIKQSA